MSNRIITISRQVGTGGHTIGRRLAGELGIPCYDQELIEQTALETGYDVDFVSEQGEFLQHRSLLFNLSTRKRAEIDQQDKVWQATVNVINKLADQGSCVFVGRCSDYILKNRPGILSAYIYADLGKRIARAETKYDILEGDIAKELKEMDKMRAAYYRYYTDMEWGNPEHYHICLNSGLLGVDKCVDILKSLF